MARVLGRLFDLHGRVRALGLLVLRQHRSPGRVALALFCGFVLGCTPLFGLHLLLCAGVAFVLRLNLPLMYAAANISIPPMVPVLGWISVQLGTFLVSGHAMHLARADFRGASLAATAARFFWAWMLGGVVLGGALGVVAGGLTYVLLRRRSAQAGDPAPPQSPDPEAAAIAQALARAARRYERCPPRYRHYARYKYRLDPVYAALCAEIPAGAEVLDLGCGLGMLPVALAELGRASRVVGLDWDAGKIAAGQQAAAGLSSVELSRGDLRAAPLPACDALTLVDVLHYYDAATQREVLGRAAAALRPGGRLLLRETDPALRGGARLTRFIERAAVRLGWNRGPRVTYRPIAELCAELAALGLEVTHRPLAATTHPGNVLLTATRPAPPAPG